MNQRIPSKIDPCPVIESIMEIRFKRKASIPPAALLGLLISKTGFTEVIELPQASIPETFVEKDPHLPFMPRYQLRKDEFILQIGTSVISINNPGDYVGWEKFSETIYFVLDQMFELDLMHEITRIGLRYIDFFENNVFDKINIDVTHNQESFSDQDLFLRYTKTVDDYRSTVQIANQVTVANNADQIQLQGSTIDIDTFYTGQIPVDKDNIKDIIEAAHIKEKEIFFGLVTEEFLQELNPEYSNG